MYENRAFLVAAAASLRACTEVVPEEPRRSMPPPPGYEPKDPKFDD